MLRPLARISAVVAVYGSAKASPLSSYPVRRTGSFYTALPERETGEFRFQLHLPLDFRVRRRNSLYLGITQCRFVDVLRLARRDAPVFDLTDEPLLIFEYLITVAVQRPFRDISEYFDFLVCLLPDAPAVSCCRSRGRYGASR